MNEASESSRTEHVEAIGCKGLNGERHLNPTFWCTSSGEC